MAETRVEEKVEQILKKHLPKNFVWKIIKAKRSHRKGRAKGGFLIGIRKGWCQVIGDAGTERE